MATIRAYTTIEQSRKLAEILPLESADMHYCLEQRGVATEYEIGVTNFNYAKRFKGICNIADVQPAWSLAALLGVIPDYTLQKIGKDVFVVYETGTAVIGTNDYDNPIDACVAMIEKLHELNLL